jgi:hypothetical protein
MAMKGASRIEDNWRFRLPGSTLARRLGSRDAGAEQVVDMDDADRAPILDHEQGGDCRGVYDLERGARQQIGRHGLRRRRHDVPGAALEQPVAHMAAQIAVGDDAIYGIESHVAMHQDAERLGSGGARRDRRRGWLNTGIIAVRIARAPASLAGLMSIDWQSQERRWNVSM